ncbi:MAG: hypothetical protein EA399_13170 [Desulfovibrionales bacterium]|nr:MAG: hypothetical protein EA399_13170 [Desulfovibrionales bacterium]
MKAGAWDYILKERTKRLGTAILSALERRKERLEKRSAGRGPGEERTALPEPFRAACCGHGGSGFGFEAHF